MKFLNELLSVYIHLIHVSSSFSHELILIHWIIAGYITLKEISLNDEF